MHEIGHNFNSGHTHDGGYSPRVDTCGCPYSNGHCADSCPSQLPLPKSATLMSYCHLCSGGYSNTDFTFGGKYSGTGPRDNINSYTNSPLAGSVSNNPRQVNVRMWGHVSSRGTCTEPYPIGVVSYFAPTPSYLFCSARMLESILSRDRCFPPTTSADADAHGEAHAEAHNVEAHAEAHHVEAHAETHFPYRETGQSDQPALYNSDDRKSNHDGAHFPYRESGQSDQRTHGNSDDRKSNGSGTTDDGGRSQGPYR